MKYSILTFAYCALLNAQAPAPIGPQFASPQPTYQEVKSLLGLSDTQVADLQKLQQEKTAQTNSYFVKVQEKRKDLTRMLEDANPDAAKVGQLLIEMQQLQKQGQPVPTDLHDKAVAILSDEQKQKLTKLDEALKMRVAADQAVQLNLLVAAPKAAPMGIPGHPAIGPVTAPPPAPPAKPVTKN